MLRSVTILVRWVVVDCRLDSSYDIVDVGVIPAGGAIAEDGNGFAVQDETGELVDGQVGTLPGSVDGEEPERDRGHPVQMGKRMTQCFAGQLGGGIGRYGSQKRVLFTEGDLFIYAVHGVGGAEDELLHLAVYRCVQQVQGAGDVHLVVEEGGR